MRVAELRGTDVMDEGDDGTRHDNIGDDDGNDEGGGDDVETMREWGDGADFSGATRLALRHEVESRPTMNKSEGIKKPETGTVGRSEALHGPGAIAGDAFESSSPLSHAALVLLNAQGRARGAQRRARANLSPR